MSFLLRKGQRDNDSYLRVILYALLGAGKLIILGSVVFHGVHTRHVR